MQRIRNSFDLNYIRITQFSIWSAAMQETALSFRCQGVIIFRKLVRVSEVLLVDQNGRNFKRFAN